MAAPRMNVASVFHGTGVPGAPFCHRLTSSASAAMNAVKNRIGV